MTATVIRPDLSQRTALSKSALNTFELCQTKAFFEIHDRRPFVPNEKVSFGSAVDAAVEKVIEDIRDGRTIDEGRALAAAEEVIERDDAGVDLRLVESAVTKFVVQAAPEFDFTDVALQAHLNVTLDGLGEIDGHPDIILRTNAPWDVKTGAPKDSAETPELGLYGLMVEAATGETVPEVGYVYYNRKLVTPKWGIVKAPFTDEYRRWAYERAAAYVRAKKADALLNARAAVPMNFAMTGGPKFDGLCGDCVYAPANGGPCALTFNREVSDVA
jgi:hypothetical protein